MSYQKNKKRYFNHALYRKPELRRLKKLLRNYSRDDIAAGVQDFLEIMMTNYIKDMINLFAPKTPIKLVLAGGVFANVKLNQKIAELKEVSSIFIHPHMGDGGLAVGAALYSLGIKGLRSKIISNVYLGDDLTEKEIISTLNKYKSKLIVSSPKELAKRIAYLLSRGKVVAIVRGRMEYGPRALGHRSILYQATDPTVNEWLNKRLKRSEFMPFAPIIQKEDLGLYFKNYKKVLPALPYMAVTVDCNKRCQKEAPAIVHIDKTARPQIVDKLTEPFIYEILSFYKKISGKKILINTSFNIHEEPIVRNTNDAIRTFLDGHLDFLVVDKYLIELKKNKKAFTS